MNRARRRQLTSNAIKRRRKKLIALCIEYPRYRAMLEEMEDGYFENNSISNASCCGWARKTKARHASQNYRHKGRYGKAIQYSAHDKRQILKEGNID